MIGYVPMPADFPHRDLFYAGRPVHQKFDEFWCRHPNMDLGQRAKIFAPFDALRGFSDAVSSKEIIYEAKREIGSQQSARLEHQLSALAALTANGKLAKKNNVIVSVEYYIPCTDRNHAAYGNKGQYMELTDRVWKVDFPKRLLYIGSCAISLDDIYCIKRAEKAV